MNYNEEAMITCERASEILGIANFDIGIEGLRAGIEQRAFPFGDCVTQRKRHFYIYKKLLAEWIQKHSGATLIFEGDLIKLVFDDGVLEERLCDDGRVRLALNKNTDA